MGNVVVDMTMSLNGCISGPNDSDAHLHDWYFSPNAENQKIIEEQIATTGAIVMGRRMYDLGAAQGGFVENPYQVPHFVLTHEPPASAAEGNTEFIFISDGVAAVIAKAKAEAGDRNVVVSGGADTVRQCLRAGLVNELWISLRPLLIADGTPLFDGLGDQPLRLEIAAVVASADTTHLRYRVT